MLRIYEEAGSGEMTQEEISDAEVVEIKAKYEKDPMTCWFCKKKTSWEQLAGIEEHEDYAAYGYCYCKKCTGRLRQAVKKVAPELIK